MSNTTINTLVMGQLSQLLPDICPSCISVRREYRPEIMSEILITEYRSDATGNRYVYQQMLDNKVLQSNGVSDLARYIADHAAYAIAGKLLDDCIVPLLKPHEIRAYKQQVKPSIDGVRMKGEPYTDGSVIAVTFKHSTAPIHFTLSEVRGDPTSALARMLLET